MIKSGNEKAQRPTILSDLMRLEIFAKMHGVHAGKQKDMQKEEGPATPKQSNSPSRHYSENKK